METQSLAGVMTRALLSPISALSMFPESNWLETVISGPSLRRGRVKIFLLVVCGGMTSMSVIFNKYGNKMQKTY